MIRAKWNSDNLSDIQLISFNDIDEPVYPMANDEIELHDQDNGRTVKGIVARVNFPTKLIYVEPDWETLIDTVE